MKRLLALAICGLLLVGCSDIDTEEPIVVGTVSFTLMADNDTGIIYIENYTNLGYCVYTPYYSENGKLCRYVDGQIVEVGE